MSTSVRMALPTRRRGHLPTARCQHVGFREACPPYLASEGGFNAVIRSIVSVFTLCTSLEYIVSLVSKRVN